MATLACRNGTFIARFTFNGREYKRLLKTDNEVHAAAALRRIEDTIHWLTIGHKAVPGGVDAGDYIVSGGTLVTPPTVPKPRVVVTLDEAVAQYQDNLGHLAESNRSTIGTHLRNFKKVMNRKVQLPLDHINGGDLHAYLQVRLKNRSSSTVSKERETLIQFFRWAERLEFLEESPANDLIPIKSSVDPSSFRTVAEIQAIHARGGLSKQEAWALWDCLYLGSEEIADILALVRERGKWDVSFMLHAIPAYSGMRRGEMLRLKWPDIEFDQNSLVARSRKQSRFLEETIRHIDMHPELRSLLLEWKDKRPRGQYVICHADSLEPLNPNDANKRFWQPLRHTNWCLSSRKNRFKIGFHTYRHSFASNLASRGVDQRIIDAWMGHQTEVMRKRYRHLFPKDRRSAIESFSFTKDAGAITYKI